MAICIVGAMLPHLLPAGELPVLAVPPLQQLQQELQDNNLDLRAMQQRVAALAAEAPAAGALPDPVVGFGLANVPIDTFELDQEAMTQKQFFVDQKFPWLGTLSLQEQRAALQARVAWFELQAKSLSLDSRLATAFFDLLLVDKSQAVNSQLQQLVQQLLRVAESRYATGQGLQQDILAAQVKLSEFVEEGIGLRSRERNLRSVIGALLNRTSSVDEHFPALAAHPPELPERARILTLAWLQNPLLQAKGLSVRLADMDIALAEKAYLPGFDVRLGYGQRDDNPATGEDRADFFSASVAMTVPLWRESKLDTKLTAAKQRKLAATNEVESMRLQLQHDIDRHLLDLAGIKESHEMFAESLTVQAGNLEDATLAAYSTGKISFDTMLSARVKVLKTELAKYRFLTDFYKKRAELWELAGIAAGQEELR